MKVAILFDHFGPYHQARLSAASSVMQVKGIEFYSLSSDYGWKSSLPKQDVVTVARDYSRTDIPPNEIFRKRLYEVLARTEADAIAVPGWSTPEAMMALSWCHSQKLPAILMSESNFWDEPRKAWKEWIKKMIIKGYSTALVGGTGHRDYLLSLGMDSSKIFLGYDAVDNGYFIKTTTLARQKSPGLLEKTFLASARFVEKKNLFRLLEAYSEYRRVAEAEQIHAPWRFTLLGDGPLRSKLEKLGEDLGLSEWISMPGFLSYEELPAYFASASAFIHASTSEQWGLVVNEAMASELPVLVSNRCGCALDLVQGKNNGLTFDPIDVHGIARAMTYVATMSDTGLSSLGAKSRELIDSWGPDRFAEGLQHAAETSLMAKANGNSIMTAAMVRLMSRC